MPTKPKILVVDDEKANCDLYYEILTSDDLYTVDLAYNGIEALAKADENHYDLIISDITMPQLDGLSFLKRVKEKNNEVEVIMISGVGSIDSAVASFKSQAYDFLTKPVEIDRLLAVVASALSKRKLADTIRHLRGRLPYIEAHGDLYRGHIVIDREGRILEVDSRLIPAWTGPKISGTSVREVQDLAYLANDLLETARTREGLARRWAVLGLRERLRILSYSTTVIEECDGGPAALGAVIDVTRIKRQEREKRDRERLSALGEMTAVVAQRVDACLQSIRQGGDNIVQEVQTLNSTMRPNISVILNNTQSNYQSVARAANQIKSLMGTLQDFAGQFVPQYTSIDVNALASQVSDPVMRSVPPDVLVTFDYQDGIPRLQGSEKDLKQTIRNLLENALQAVRGRGEILVQTGEHDGLVTVTVADNGTGIAWEDQEKIFEPFFSRWGNNSKGLGLAMARKVIEDHDGVITMESLEGQGSIFTIHLPAPIST